MTRLATATAERIAASRPVSEPGGLRNIRGKQVENESRQSWVLIAIASLGLVLGVIALIVAFNAKSASDDAASQQSVEEVSSELSNLVDRLGIAEASLTGEQKELQGKAKRAAQESEKAVVNLSNRLDRLERETAKLNATSEQTAKLTKQVGSMKNQIATLDSQVTAVNQRVTKLSKRVNSAGSSSNGGGQTAP
jgi:septal ring factor EnvC (AmiA/AmiB activator)